MTSRDYFLEEIMEQPRIFNQLVHRGDFERIAGDLARRRFERIVITGCGDSHCAALAAWWFFRETMKREVFSLEAMNAARYLSDLFDERTLLLAVSASGRTPRVIECVQVARERGAFVLSITDNPSGELYGSGDDAILLGASPPEELKKTCYRSDPAKEYTGYHHEVGQTKTFTASMLALFLLAAKMGSLSRDEGRRGQSGSLERSLKEVSESCGDIISALNEQARAFAAGLDGAGPVFFLASGPCGAIARFGAYKMHEFALMGSSQDIEEYCHTYYYITDASATVVGLCPDTLSESRFAEIAPELSDSIGARVAAVVPEGAEIDRAFCIRIPWQGPTAVSPLVYALAVELIAHAIAVKAKRSTSIFRGGIETEKYVAGAMRIIRRSAVLLPSRFLTTSAEGTSQ